jgi:AcrR family transcriptional regulator
VPIDEIARRAGLGVGTLYRHFPTKEALFAAIVAGRMQSLVDEARAGLKAKDPAAAFFGIVGRIVEESSVKKDFIDALGGTGAELARSIGPIKQELHATVELLLKRAQRAKVVRRDVGVREVMALAMGAVAAFDRLGGDARGRERLLAVVRDGLKAGWGR